MLKPRHTFESVARQIVDGLTSGQVELPASTRSPEPARVFCSYSHKDAELRTELENHLSELRSSGLIETWYDRKIAPGMEWTRELDEQLHGAHLILLLVTPDFLTSHYCCDVEMKTAMELHASGNAVVVPVILRAVDWMQAPFAKLQAIPKDGKAVTSWSNRDEAFTDVAESIRDLIEDLPLVLRDGCHVHPCVAAPPRAISAE